MAARRRRLELDTESETDRDTPLSAGTPSCVANGTPCHGRPCHCLVFHTYNHVPAWLRDNDYIRSGYRVNYGWRKACQSLCHCHNETVNIWTHLLGAIFVILLLLYTVSLSPHGFDWLCPLSCLNTPSGAKDCSACDLHFSPNATKANALAVMLRDWARNSETALHHMRQTAHELAEDAGLVNANQAWHGAVSPGGAVMPFLPRWPLWVFMISAVLCMGMSAFFHLFQAVSERTAVLFQRLDYAGICLLIAGSGVPVLYYGFYCSVMLRNIYVICILVIGLISFVVSLLEFFNRPQYRTFRALMFIGQGLVSGLPILHMVHHHGEVHEVIAYLAAMGALYIAGAGLYAARVPERCVPGHFDHIGASHQLFHVFVILAVMTHYVGLMRFYEWRILEPCMPES